VPGTAESLSRGESRRVSLLAKGIQCRPVVFENCVYGGPLLDRTNRQHFCHRMRIEAGDEQHGSLQLKGCPRGGTTSGLPPYPG
jgi:hypothetical protein